MFKKNKKLILGSLLGALSVLAICACLIANTNMTNQINGDNDYLPAVTEPEVTEPVAQSKNVEADSTVDTYQSPNVRYVDQIYSSEVNQSMQRIQESYAESVKDSNNAVAEATNNQFREGSVGSSASKLASNLLANNNNASSNIKWSVTLNNDKEFDTFTLHISTYQREDYDIGSEDNPAWRNGFTAIGLDGKEHKYKFFDITKVSIDSEIQPKSCKAWFGCADSNPGQTTVRLSNIESINNLTSLDMTDVENASFMFMGCDLLELNELPDMPLVTNIEAAFALTKKLKNEIYNSAANSFKTIQNGKDAFINNTTLTDINVSNWNADEFTNMSYIFCNCPNLTTINSKVDTDWSQKSFNDTGMFKGCESLKGGQNTPYNSQFTGKSYAKVDGGTSSPGYFTALEPPADWIPMQAKANADENPIDFYPAFSNPSQIAGYEFATYDGTNYHEIQNINSMSDIYSALQNPSNGDKTTTLYYQKTDSDADSLKCYTVKDLTWDYVFGTTIESGEATSYSYDFIQGYQYDGLDANGIKTALLATDGFGSDWNVNSSGFIAIPKLVNGVVYANNSSNNGFYECYGGYDGGLLSSYSDYPWGCYAYDSISAFCFAVRNGGWGINYRGNEGGVVLARAFN